jgi:signal transduction histidine kinase
MMGIGPPLGATTRRLMLLVLSISLTATATASMITILSIAGTQQDNFRRYTVVHRAEEIARVLIASPNDEAQSILDNAAEPDLTLKLERPSPDRRRYLEKTIEQYIRPAKKARPEGDGDEPSDLAGQEYHPPGPTLRAAREALGLSRRDLAYVLEGTGRDFWRVSIPVNDGQWLSVEAKPEFAPENDFPPIAFLLLAVIAVIALGSIFALRRIGEPLRALETAAINLGRDLDAPPLDERGPGDVRRVAHAFNAMQAQIRRFVGDRTTMLAAISHDLRSPLQRLRFRADFMTDEAQREKMLRDLRDMETMIAATLDFARADADGERPGPCDLAALVGEVAEGLKDSGYRVEIAKTPEHMPYRCRARALKRAVENLAGNAATYGGIARISLEEDRSTGQIVIQVEDDGPGLRRDDLERVFEPFYRVDSSRNPEGGGTGLGLSIARSIVRGHGGDIVLVNRPVRGLTARLTLPI